MSELFDKSIRTLELPRVLELLAEQAVSAAAKDRCRRLRPETEAEEVLRLLDQTDAARAMIGLRGSPSFSGVKPVAEALDRADRGGSLNNHELLTIADLLTAARRCKEYFNDEAAEKTAIDHLFLSLHGNRFLEEKIKRCLPDEDTVADAASTELADIRRHMRAAQAKSRQILQKIISSPTYGKILQETIITQRDGRFVVPVKAEHKGDLPGLVHDISSTGATLFVEPMGLNTEELYIQGFSSSMPEEVQIEMLHSVKGLEHAEIMRPAYAIEYDCVDPTSLEATLESKVVRGLYGAGQFNGTSGYEEAAAQGLLAGLNAARKALGESQLILPRQSSYLGTLVDDLVTKGVMDPYRMMTSRSEYRLTLRQDNADQRLTPIGREYGLVQDDRWAKYQHTQQILEAERRRLHETHLLSLIHI